MVRLVAEFAAPLYRYAYRLTGSAADAEDLTQQTFLIAQERIGQVREADKVGRWLYAVLRNTFLKSRRRSGPVALRTLAIDIDQLPAEEEGIEVDQELVRQCLADLPEEFRIVLLLFYFEDLSYKEIAAELDCPLGTVMSRLSRAKQHLRAGLLAREVPAH
jgi:RNA polymerase sigma-70 factor (ECF subfamily)